jgi:hypothetical protein
MPTLSDVIRGRPPGAGVRQLREDLLNLILGHRLEISVDAQDSRIRRTVQWLLSVQNSDGSWGRSNVAETSMAILALVETIPTTQDPELELVARESFQRARDFLASTYRHNQFEGIVWDTAVALRALRQCPDPPARLSDEMLRWLVSLPPHSVPAGPHHLAQRILTLLDYGVSRDLVAQAASEMTARVERGRFKYSAYVIAQCLQAVQECGDNSNGEPYLERLQEFLGETNLDSANFVNICAAIHALSMVRTFDAMATARVSVASFFGPNCFREDGTFYHDEWATSWGLIALMRFSQESVVRAPHHELTYGIQSAFHSFEKSIRDEVMDRDTAWAIHVAIAIFLGALLGFFITFSTVDRSGPEWINWSVPALCTVLGGFVAQFVSRALRHRGGDPTSGS